MLFDLRIRHLVQPHEGRHVGVERGKGLRARPFVLQGPQEIHNLSASGREMPGRIGRDGASNPVESLLQQGFQRPPRTVPREHIQVVDVEVAIPVRLPGGGAVDAIQPIVRHHLPRAVQNQPAHGITLIRVGVDSPIGPVEVLVDGFEGVDKVVGVGALVRGGGVGVVVFRHDYSFASAMILYPGFTRFPGVTVINLRPAGADSTTTSCACRKFEPLYLVVGIRNRMSRGGVGTQSSAHRTASGWS